MLADAEFVEQLRFATQRYFDAIDAWEVAYQKYYRLPTHGSVSSDLEAEHSAYLAARGQLQRLVPNARRLCLRHSLRDPWPALLHINLESSAPQSGGAPAIGRSERLLVSKCLDELELAVRNPEESSQARETSNQIPGRRNILQKIADYFL
jgi:hypothetical protein